MNHHTPPQGGVLCWVHPAVGELRLDREVMELPATDAQQLVVFVLPADAATADAVDQLRRAATPLRAVP